MTNGKNATKDKTKKGQNRKNVLCIISGLGRVEKISGSSAGARTG